jgi:hypothetical protein
MRDRLIELIKQGARDHTFMPTERIADYLLANGVIVPPCKVGDTVYSIVEGISFVLVGEVYEYVVGREHFVFRSTRKGYFTLAFTEIDIGKTVFLTREEAEKALAERSEA